MPQICAFRKSNDSFKYRTRVCLPLATRYRIRLEKKIDITLEIVFIFFFCCKYRRNRRKLERAVTGAVDSNEI